MPVLYVVGRASAPQHLTSEQYAVWGIAHGDRDSAVKLKLTAVELNARARRAGVANAEAVVAELFASGDLVELDTGRGKHQEFMSRYRLKPLAYGMGNDPKDREVSYIGTAEQPRAMSVPDEVCTAFELGLTSMSIWDRAEYIAEGRREAKVHASYSGDVNVVAEWIAQTLPLFMATGCGFLDEHVDAFPPRDG